MKYFTLFTLTLLAVDAASNSASGTEKESNAFLTTFNEFFYSLTHFFTKPKNLIKARLELPKPLSAEKFVTISPSENICVFTNESEFWKTLYKQSEPAMIEKTIFCPNAIPYLRNISAAKLISSAKGEQLSKIIAALLLRRATLINEYSSAYVENRFGACFDALWKASSTSTGNNPYWPCDGSPCTAETIKANFATLIKDNKACKEILSDQLTTYADTVAKLTTSTEKPVTSAVEIREAIRENLNACPHFSIAFKAAFDGVSEFSDSDAAAKIKSALEDVKNVLKKQLDETNADYANGEKMFNERFAGKKTDKPVETAAEKDKIKSEDSNKVDTPSKSDVNVLVPVDKKTDSPTKTDKEPTKTA